ncbi:unnamed protein product [Polarella glacialis]|uniref:Uncharacterized protein n=1 Tax=Polarella glacialis TaxID=89957 RepID=A0A813LNS1_POLGL|nr:unnamed protein product [Polarella glacialis]
MYSTAVDCKGASLFFQPIRIQRLPQANNMLCRSQRSDKPSKSITNVRIYPLISDFCRDHQLSAVVKLYNSRLLGTPNTTTTIKATTTTKNKNVPCGYEAL